MPLGLFIHVPASLGYAVVGLLIGGESAGVPLPGETSLIAAGVLAARGQLNIVAVIAIAATAAIVGDNIGYLIGRRGGRWILTRPGPWHEKRIAMVDRGDAFFKKHGAKTVFFGRWLPVVRITAAWMAGVNGMEWKRFAAYNALGGIGWAISIGLLAYYVGNAAEAAIRDFGLAGIGLVVLLLVALVAIHVVRKRREARTVGPEPIVAVEEPAE